MHRSQFIQNYSILIYYSIMDIVQCFVRIFKLFIELVEKYLKLLNWEIFLCIKVTCRSIFWPQMPPNGSKDVKGYGTEFGYKYKHEERWWPTCTLERRYMQRIIQKLYVEMQSSNHCFSRGNFKIKVDRQTGHIHMVPLLHLVVRGQI